jgi:hypothetical protein
MRKETRNWLWQAKREAIRRVKLEQEQLEDRLLPSAISQNGFTNFALSAPMAGICPDGRNFPGGTWQVGSVTVAATYPGTLAAYIDNGPSLRRCDHVTPYGSAAVSIASNGTFVMSSERA